MKATDSSMGSLSAIQTNQIAGMIYCAVKKVKLHKMVKQGNVITITYDTELAENAKKLKKAQMVFSFIDAVSEDIATNDFSATFVGTFKNSHTVVRHYIY